MRVMVCLLVVLAATPLLGGPEQAAPLAPAAKADEAPKASEVKAAEVVPDLPDFPGAVMASYEEKGPGDGWVKTWKRETRVTAPYAAVRRFYVEQLAKKGWTISSTKEKLDEVEWGLTRGASWAEVEIEAEHGVVKVAVERKDR
jgi:hypothetical protein